MGTQPVFRWEPCTHLVSRWNPCTRGLPLDRFARCLGVAGSLLVRLRFGCGVIHLKLIRLTSSAHFYCDVTHRRLIRLTWPKPLLQSQRLSPRPRTCECDCCYTPVWLRLWLVCFLGVSSRQHVRCFFLSARSLLRGHTEVVPARCASGLSLPFLMANHISVTVGAQLVAGPFYVIN
jgi:hypothetical protein